MALIGDLDWDLEFGMTRSHRYCAYSAALGQDPHSMRRLEGEGQREGPLFRLPLEG